MTRVFWLDDEADRLSFDTTCEVLEASGIQVTRTTSVADAARILFEEGVEFDLILLDVLMPPQGRYSSAESANGTTTGLRFLEELRQSRPSVPVILVTVTEQAKDLEYFLRERHIDGYINKPFLPHDLLSEIMTVLSRS